MYLYPLGTLLQLAIPLLYFFPQMQTKQWSDLFKQINSITINSFLILEFICIYYFYYKLPAFRGRPRLILIISFILFLFIYLYSSVISESNQLVSFKLNFTKSCFILLPSFIYTFKLFKGPPTLKLANEPAFWFNSGVFILFLLTLPLNLIIESLVKNHSSFFTEIFINVGYYTIYGMLIKAYYCDAKPIGKTTIERLRTL